jgi:pectin methylesterase-like acyl-CoA thioesterase
VNRTADRLLLALVIALAVASLRCPTTSTAGRPALPKADITVAQDGSGDYETISEALEEASAEDVILIKPGVYEEEVVIDTDEGPFTLVGVDPKTTVIDAGGEYAALSLKSDGNRVSRLTLRGGESHGLYIPGGHQKIDYCLIVDNDDRGIYISTLEDGGSADIDHCTVADNAISAIYCANKDDETTVSNCIFAHNKRSLVYDGDGENLVVDYTCLYSKDTDSDKAEAGSNNIRKDPGFKDHADGDYSLEKDSPCLKTGKGNTNRGCF